MLVKQSSGAALSSLAYLWHPYQHLRKTMLKLLSMYHILTYAYAKAA